jgi:hypothetical protein
MEDWTVTQFQTGQSKDHSSKKRTTWSDSDTLSKCHYLIKYSNTQTLNKGKKTHPYQIGLTPNYYKSFCRNSNTRSGEMHHIQHQIWNSQTLKARITAQRNEPLDQIVTPWASVTIWSKSQSLKDSTKEKRLILIS